MGQFSPQYQQPPQQQQQQQTSGPDYRVGGMYGANNVNDSRGHTNAQPNTSNQNNAYDMRQFEQTPPMSGYSTLPARSGGRQSNEAGFRPVPPGQQEQNRNPYSPLSNIQVQSTARGDGSYSQPMSPVQYSSSGNRNEPQQYQRQNSVGQQNTNTGYQPSQIKKPVPFSPGSGYNYSQNGSATLPLQRQTSSGQSPGNKFESTISSPYQSGGFSPKSDDAPPPPPPPTNYQPETYGRPSYDQQPTNQSPYQRQTSQSQPNSYGTSPYEQRQNNYNAYQSQQSQDMYSAPQQPQYQRQGSRGYQYDSPQQQPQQQQQNYQRQTSNPAYYNDRGTAPTSQPRYEPPQQPQYGGQYSSPQQPPQPPQPPQQTYSRQTSRDQNQPQYGQPQHPMSRQHSRDQHIDPPMNSHPTSPPGNTINSFEDILSPFENFQNSNYCDKLFARTPDTRGDMDSGVSMSSDTPRSNQSSTYSPPQPFSTGYNEPGEVPDTQNLLRPAPPAPPPPAVTPPPPPPPPPPPSDWSGQQKRKVVPIEVKLYRSCYVYAVLLTLLIVQQTSKHHILFQFKLIK